MNKDSAPKMTLNRTLKEISKFQFILSEGRKGNHLLFTPEMIRRAFSKNQEELFDAFQSKLEEINRVLNETFMIKTFEEKSQYIQSLPQEIQSAIVFGYFQLLEGQEQEKSEHIVH